MEQELLDDGLYRSVAANGLTVLSEKLPGVRSAAVGIWVRSASSHSLSMAGQVGLPSYSTAAAPANNALSTAFHIIQPVVV